MRHDGFQVCIDFRGALQVQGAESTIGTITMRMTSEVLFEIEYAD